MAKIIKHDFRVKAFKRKEFKEKFKSKFTDVKNWVVRHRVELLTFGPVIITSLATIFKVVGRSHNLHKEEANKNLYCYDNRLGHYWALRRKLSNKEWLEIDRRKKNGERLADILAELKVLK